MALSSDSSCSTSSIEKLEESPCPRLEIVKSSDGRATAEDYEQLFKNRYTEEDEYFQCSISRKLRPPPAIYPWYSKARRNFDYSKKQFSKHNYEGWWNDRGRRRFANNHGQRWNNHGPPQGSSNAEGSGDQEPSKHDTNERRQHNRHRPY